METGRNVMHYALGDNQDYEHEWSKAVLEYLENGYSSEDSKSEVEVGNTTYKILKREKVTAFYDADGNTLFDIENDRLKEEYEAMESLDETEPKSEIGRAIAGIEKQAFEQAVDNNIGTDEMIPMGTASLKEIAKGIPAPTPEEVETAKKNNSSVYIGVVGAVTKLQEELKKAKDKSFADPIIKHLIERCRESESLASDVCQDHKTWEKCYKYIYEQARKQAKGSSCAVLDDVVYEYNKYGFVITLHQYCICPRCNHILNAGPDYQPDYCSKCGQHVNCSDVPWEEEVQLGYVRKEERCE